MKAPQPAPVQQPLVPRTWPSLNTPLHIFLAVMLPICALMAFLAIVPHVAWVRTSAVFVIALSFYVFLRGYLRRLVVDDRGIALKSLLLTFRIPWSEVRRIDRYVPSGAANGIAYVYITTRDAPPAGKWEIDSQMLQLQDRPGMLDTLQSAWRDFQYRNREEAARGTS